MDSLLYFAFWAGLIFLMMRLGCGAHIMGHRQDKQDEPAAGAGGATRNPRWLAPETDVDPVCGKTVATADAKSAVHDGWVHYFCSSDCRERFEAAPDLYLAAHAAHPKPQLEHSHD
jgi:YHS domain-containing protein